jgi:ketosteroid isomerase-like protein
MRATGWLTVGTLTLALTAAPAARAQDAPQPLPHVELPAQLDRVLRDYEAGWRARDAEALAALFAEAGFILRPNRPPVRGREAIREAYAGSGGPLVLRAYAYEVSDSVGYILGGFAMAAGDPDGGKFILTLRRESGRWMITADMDNGNR